METATRKYETIGTTDEWDGCDCCGRVNLKVYVVMREIDGGEVMHFGTGCAAKLENVPAATIRDEVKAADKAAHEARMAEMHSTHAAEAAAYNAWLVENTGTSDPWEAAKVLNLDGAFAVRKAYRAAA